jgi:hypothetical protein
MRFLSIAAVVAAFATASAGAAAVPSLPPQALTNGACGIAEAFTHAAAAPPFAGVEPPEECEREHGVP